MLYHVSLLLETRPLSVLTRGQSGVSRVIVVYVTCWRNYFLGPPKNAYAAQDLHIYFNVICNFLSSGLKLNCISILLHFFPLGRKAEQKEILSNQECTRGLHKQGHFSPKNQILMCCLPQSLEVWRPC